MEFTLKDYLATASVLVMIFAAESLTISTLYPLLMPLALELRIIIIILLILILFGLLLISYAKILRSLVPFKDSVFSANEDTTACFVWKQTVFVYEWTASILSYITPVLLRPLLYTLLGAEIGKGVLFAGKIVEPQMVRIGSYSNIGEMALLMAHAIVKDGVVLKHITIGNRVAVGAHAVIMPGVEIGDESIVGAGALVLSDTIIPPREIWGGVPARKIKDID